MEVERSRRKTTKSTAKKKLGLKDSKSQKQKIEIRTYQKIQGFLTMGGSTKTFIED